jgi:hypothetical protein
MTSLNLANNHIAKEEDTISPPRQGLQKGDIVDGKRVTTIYDNGNIRVTDFSGILAVANAIKDMRAISSVNLLKNDIGVAQAEDLVSILKVHPTLKSLCGNSGDETELDMSGKMNGAADAIILVPEIINNRALTKFDISKNNLYAAGTTALAEGLKGNQVMTELNLAGNVMGKGSGRGYNGVTDMSGVAALADVIPGMGALSIANVMGNRIGKEMLSKLQEIMRSKPNLVSLCGIADDATEADVSGLSMDADDVSILVSELPDKRALAKLIFGGIKYVKDNIQVTPAPAILKVGMTEANFSNKNLGANGVIIISAWICHKDNGALTSLNLSTNRLTGPWGDDMSGNMRTELPYDVISD